MVPTAKINDTRLIVEQFASGIQNKDFELIASLLAEDGEFNTQDAKLNTIDGGSNADFIKPKPKSLLGNRDF